MAEPINSKLAATITPPVNRAFRQEHSVHETLKRKEAPKAVRNQVNKLAYRAANIGSMLVK
jgi:hypothetical protein